MDRATGWLSLADPTPGSQWRSNLEWFRLFLFLHMGARSLLSWMATVHGNALDAFHLVAVAVAVLGFVPGFAQRAVRAAFVIVAGQLLTRVALQLDTANHVFLEAAFLGFFALCSADEEDEARLLLQAMRFTVAIFFFYTGLQKVLYGYYFRAEFLTYMAVTSDFFATVFQWMIPQEDLARLQAFNGPSPSPGRYSPAIGAGPYRVDSPLFVLTANLVYVFEMGAGLLLLHARARSFVALAAIAFVFAIEAGARELTFGILMVNLLLLFMDGAWVRKLFPVCALAYLYLLLGENGGLGWLPMFRYAPA